MFLNLLICAPKLLKHTRLNTFLNEKEMKFFGVVKQRATMINNFENL